MLMKKHLEELEAETQRLDDFEKSIAKALSSSPDWVITDERTDLPTYVSLGIRHHSTRQELKVPGRLMIRVLRENLRMVLDRVLEIQRDELAGKKQELMKIAEEVVMKYADSSVQTSAEFEVFVGKFVKDRPEQ
jgi:hypothetical protein